MMDKQSARSENHTAKQHLSDNFPPQSPINVQNPVNGSPQRNANTLQPTSPMHMQNAGNVQSIMSVKSAVNPQSPLYTHIPAQCSSPTDNSMNPLSPVNVYSSLTLVTRDRQTPRPAQHSAPFYTHPTSPPTIQSPMSYQSLEHMHQQPRPQTNWQTAMQQKQQQPSRNADLSPRRPPLQSPRNAQSQATLQPHMVKQEGGQPYSPANWQTAMPPQSPRNLPPHGSNNHNYRQPLSIRNVPSQSHLQPTPYSISHYAVRPGSYKPWQLNVRMQNAGNPSMSHIPKPPRFSMDPSYFNFENSRQMIIEFQRQLLHYQMYIQYVQLEVTRHKDEMKREAHLQEVIQRRISMRDDMKRRASVEEEMKKRAHGQVQVGMNRQADAPSEMNRPVHKDNELNRHTPMQEEMRMLVNLQEDMKRQAHIHEEMRRELEAYKQEEMKKPATVEERIRRGRIVDEIVRQGQLMEQQRIFENEIKSKIEMGTAMHSHEHKNC